MSPERRRLAAYGLVVAVAFGGAWRMESTVNRLDDVVRDNEAERCIDDWDDYHNDLDTGPLVGEALLEFSQGQADPADVTRFERIVDRLVSELIVPPECDLAGAEARLDK